MSDLDLRQRLTARDGSWRELSTELRGLPDPGSLLLELERLAETDPEVDVRYKARKLLAALSDRAPATGTPSGIIAIPPVLGRLAEQLQGRDADARVRVIERFAKAHRSAGVDELIPLLRSETDAAVLSVLVSIVGTSGNASHLRDLRPFLGHQNQRVVANAVEAMGRLDPGAALPMVLPVLVADDHRVRANVLIVLYKEWKPEVLAYLSRMTMSPKESYRASAVWCLGQIEDVEADETLVQMLASGGSGELSDSIFQVFANKRGVAAIPLLCRVVQDQPHFADRARSAISAIAARTGLTSEQLQDIVAKQHQEPVAAPSGLGQRLKRITRTVRAVLLSERARKANQSATRPITPVSADAEPESQRGLVIAASGGLALLVGLLLTGSTIEPAPGTVRREATQSQAMASGSVNPGGVARFVAVVRDRVDSMLVVEKDHTIYALTYKDVRDVDSFAADTRVFVTARYRNWNTAQRRAEMDGETIVLAR